MTSEIWVVPPFGKRIFDLNQVELIKTGCYLHDCSTIAGTGLLAFADLANYIGWCGHTARTSPGFWKGLEDLDLERLFDLTLSALFAESSQAHDRHIKLLIGKQWYVATYLAFPLLEGVLRKVCSNFVDRNGRLLNNWNGKRAGTQINNVSTLLKRYVTDEACTTEAARAIERILDKVLHETGNSSSPDKSGFDVIFEWRNSTLHGNTAQAAAVTLITLVCIIVIDHTPDVLDRRFMAIVSAKLRADWYDQSDTHNFAPFHFPLRREEFALLPEPDELESGTGSA